MLGNLNVFLAISRFQISGTTRLRPQYSVVCWRIAIAFALTPPPNRDVKSFKYQDLMN